MVAKELTPSRAGEYGRGLADDHDVLDVVANPGESGSSRQLVTLLHALGVPAPASVAEVRYKGWRGALEVNASLSGLEPLPSHCSKVLVQAWALACDPTHASRRGGGPKASGASVNKPLGTSSCPSWGGARIKRCGMSGGRTMPR
jgi:hypothetical protein